MANNSKFNKPVTLQKGKYVFTEGLQVIENEGSGIPYIVGKAISILEKDGLTTGDISILNMSDLILKQSSYTDENGRVIEAHKLYTWPRDLGSTAAWTAAKKEFLNQYILNFPIEVTSTAADAGLSWKFITPENFKRFPEDIQASAAFKEFTEQQHSYFFLRRPIQEPR